VTVRVAVDALGGDRAPDEIVAGAEAAAGRDLEPILFGSSDIVASTLPVIETSGAIGMDEHAVEAVRAKPESSLVRAVRSVADGDADAVVSAGNTGALLAASLLHLRRLPGVHRPGIGIVIPTRQGPSVLIDAGANADARPEHLLQFAHMGTVFAEEILGVRDPLVRLLSIGEEDEKGSQLTRAAFDLLRGSDLRFAGNTEGRTLLSGGTDVVVTDGFTGNVALKTLEGTVSTLLAALRDELRSSLRGRVGGLFVRRAARTLRTRLDPETYGGGYLLGLNGVVVVAHGSSSRVAIANAIRLAARGVDNEVVPRLRERLAPGVLASARSTTPTPEK
jgi:glycerol-3-phosphate acyltransferase PlsX